MPSVSLMLRGSTPDSSSAHVRLLSSPSLRCFARPLPHIARATVDRVRFGGSFFSTCVWNRARTAIVVGLCLSICVPLATAGGARKYQLVVPHGYDGGRPLPLVMLLHGYKDTSLGINLWFKLQPAAD